MLNSNDIVEKLRKRFTPEKLRDLKWLTEHAGWTILIELAELHKIELWLSTTNIDWDNDKQIKILKDQWIYIQAMISILKIPWNMEKVETFQEYKESDIMPMYDWWFDIDDDEPNDV